MRIDHKIIVDLVDQDAKVLDMGCGDGSLLALLKKKKGCRGSGIEIDEQAIYSCMEKGITVSHGDIDTGLTDYSDNRFDFVILNGSLQEVIHPKRVILEALRVGKKVIVGIPNFCFYKSRWQIFFHGKVPITDDLPYEWYDTPNLRFLSLRDFRHFCRTFKIKILKKFAVRKNSLISYCPNLFANTGIYLLEKK